MLQVGGFAWENCGDRKNPVVLQSLSVAPDPGFYSLPASDFDLPDVELPSWMTNGNYRVRATASKGGQELACVQLTFSLQSH
ncbi:PREDICTED: ganglioside GM2 activator [Buceros rhinoceros silvestris]|uniref:ganglioside GM2 activator n=1 Tax=Buceros rhinoceros silvestris TaxID=175836 RepID=UPI0005291A3A|nr:PREDICTED: ganglioside GM2 activator [Buceros rhinoceros silvestris]